MLLAACYVYIPRMYGFTNGIYSRWKLRPICHQKAKFVAFIKVHKAASTTVTNILMRFAYYNNLNPVLPKRTKGWDKVYLAHGEILHDGNIFPIPDNESFNILASHCVFNKYAISLILPADTLYFAIVRKPAGQFLSAALYYSFYLKLLTAIRENKLP